MNFSLVDLTHQIFADMPVYPGDEMPRIITVKNYNNDGYQETRLNISSHTGTHIDCPLHFFKDTGSTGSLPVENFFGKAVKIDCTKEKDCISKETLEKKANILVNSEFVLFYTGYEKLWGRQDYFSGFPVLTDKAVEYLVTFRLKGIGFDTISADQVKSIDFKVHKAILGKGMVIIENLTGLENLPVEEFYFSCFPLHISGGDGSPVRAVAYIILNE